MGRESEDAARDRDLLSRRAALPAESDDRGEREPGHPRRAVPALPGLTASTTSGHGAGRRCARTGARGAAGIRCSARRSERGPVVEGGGAVIECDPGVVGRRGGVQIARASVHDDRVGAVLERAEVVRGQARHALERLDVLEERA